eukprot:1628414-Pyramimonas_sp.AAC.1
MFAVDLIDDEGVAWCISLSAFRMRGAFSVAHSACGRERSASCIAFRVVYSVVCIRRVPLGACSVNGWA